MPLVPAVQVVQRLRTEEIVVTTMGTAREWPRLSQHPLDLHYIPSSMGQSPTLALGLAIAQPQREVIAFTGDGSLLMNLGCLVTIVASGAKNLTLIVIDNGVYEVTGGQRTAGAVAGVDFAAVARAAGFPSVERFDELGAWQGQAAEALKLPGPRCIVLATEPVLGDSAALTAPGPIGPRLERFRTALKAAATDVRTVLSVPCVPFREHGKLPAYRREAQCVLTREDRFMKQLAVVLSLGLGIAMFAGCEKIKREAGQTVRGVGEHALSNGFGKVQDKGDEAVNKATDSGHRQR